MDENGDSSASSSRTELGRFSIGHAGGPGRPRNAITNSLRRLIDPDAVANFLIAAMGNPHLKMRDRLLAAGMIYERLEGKAPQAIALAVQNVDGAALPSNFDELTPAQRIAFLDSMPGIKPLGLGK